MVPRWKWPLAATLFAILHFLIKFFTVPGMVAGVSDAGGVTRRRGLTGSELNARYGFLRRRMVPIFAAELDTWFVRSSIRALVLHTTLKPPVFTILSTDKYGGEDSFHPSHLATVGGME